MKSQTNIERRAEFVKKALRDKQAAADELRDLALSLENCRTWGDVIYSLQDILYINERTVFRDIKR